MAALREQGITLEEIGRRLGVTRQAVSDTLRRLRRERLRAGSSRATPGDARGTQPTRAKPTR
jgi:predicted transcriptional regulator